MKGCGMQQLLPDLVQLLALFQCGGSVGCRRARYEDLQNVICGDAGSGSDLVGAELNVAVS